jgi:hypothetical protein
VGAIAVSLLTHHHLPWDRICDVLADLVGVPFSACALMAEQVIHQDETGLSVKGRRAWMRVTSTTRRTHSQVHPS